MADLLLYALAHSGKHLPPKSATSQVAESILGEGERPADVIEVEILERFGWTYEDLDNADPARLLPAIYLSNIDGALRRIRRWLEMGGKTKLSENDWKIYLFAMSQWEGKPKPSGVTEFE